MIRIDNWVASIPEEDKHIAYVGEGLSETRTFFLTGEGWERYKDWSFHLDMAFDLSTVTVEDSRQVVKTTTDSTQDSTKDVTGQVTGQNNRQTSTETDGTSTLSDEDTVTRSEENTQGGEGAYTLSQRVTESGQGSESGTTHSATTLTEGGSTEQNTEQSTEGQVKTKTTVTRETYTDRTRQVSWEVTTDIASLDKTVEADGIRLVWTVLRQQTQLPGKLRANLRAVGASYAQVKKSAMMVFEVEPAVIAYAAVDLPQSQFEQMEERMDDLCEQTRLSAQEAEEFAEAAQQGMLRAMGEASLAKGYAEQAKAAAAGINAVIVDDALNLHSANPIQNAAVTTQFMLMENRLSVLGDVEAALDSILAIQEALLPPVPITFYVNSNTYQALKGMTWLDWVNSEYNIHGYVCADKDSLVHPDAGSNHLAVRLNEYVLAAGGDLILEDAAYRIDYVGA